nr:hypothetical protein [Erwinia amylovora]
MSFLFWFIASGAAMPGN